MTEIFIPTERLFSNSRVENDLRCRRAGYLSREWGGTGLVPLTPGWDLVFGNIIHKWLDTLAQNGTVDFIAVRNQVHTEALKAFDQIHAKDWAVLAEGLMRGFTATVWPNMMAEYEVEAPESWIEYVPKPGFRFRARRDLILRSKIDGHRRYVEYKTSSSNRYDYLASFAKSVQLHTGMVLEKYVNNSPVQDGVVQVLYKGYRAKKNPGQVSVFTQGYCNRQFSMTPDYKVEYTRAKGWESFSTFDEFPDLTSWVSLIQSKHPDVMNEQFPRTAPIYPREDIVQKFFKQEVIRQGEIQEGVELLSKATTVEAIDDILDQYFRQNFSQCQPAYGFDCQFLELCWKPWVAEDPVGSGLFKRYDPDWEKAVEVLE